MMDGEEQGCFDGTDFEILPVKFRESKESPI